MREYKTARTVIGFLEFLAWAMIVMGVIVALTGMGLGGKTANSLFGGGARYGAFAGFLPGFIVAVIGLMGVVFCQLTRAAVDTAEMTGQLLANSNDELRLLKAQLKNGGLGAPVAGAKPAPVHARTAPAANPRPVSSSPAKQIPVLKEPDLLVFQGMSIRRVPLGIHYGGKTYPTIETVYDTIGVAREHIPEEFRHPPPPVEAAGRAQSAHPLSAPPPNAHEHPAPNAPKPIGIDATFKAER